MNLIFYGTVYHPLICHIHLSGSSMNICIYNSDNGMNSDCDITLTTHLNK